MITIIYREWNSSPGISSQFGVLPDNLSLWLCSLHWCCSCIKQPFSRGHGGEQYLVTLRLHSWTSSLKSTVCCWLNDESSRGQDKGRITSHLEKCFANFGLHINHLMILFLKSRFCFSRFWLYFLELLVLRKYQSLGEGRDSTLESREASISSGTTGRKGAGAWGRGGGVWGDGDAALRLEGMSSNWSLPGLKRDEIPGHLLTYLDLLEPWHGTSGSPVFSHCSWLSSLSWPQSCKIWRWVNFREPRFWQNDVRTSPFSKDQIWLCSPS